MPGILLGETLTMKDMAQMALAIGTNNLHPPTICIRVSFNSSRDLIVETGPTTAGIKFVV